MLSPALIVILRTLLFCGHSINEQNQVELESTCFTFFPYRDLIERYLDVNTIIFYFIVPRKLSKEKEVATAQRQVFYTEIGNNIGMLVSCLKTAGFSSMNVLQGKDVCTLTVAKNNSTFALLHRIISLAILCSTLRPES